MQKQGGNGQGDSTTPGWKKFHGEMVNKMRIEKLKEALKRRERVQLEEAIKDAQGAQSEHPALAEAEAELQIIDVRDELQTAMENKDANCIRAAIDKIRSEPFFHTRLQPNLSDARRELDRLDRLYRLSSYILDMDRKTMGEMRRYHHPPQVVHRVIQAVMLLFKQDEESTEKWPVCQQLLQPNGPTGMNRRVLDFDVNGVHPEVASRTNEVLSRYELSKVQDVSSGAATFYVWAMGVLEEMGPNIKVKPADIKRQKELFAPPPIVSPRRRRKQGSVDESVNVHSPRKY